MAQRETSLDKPEAYVKRRAPGQPTYTLVSPNSNVTLLPLARLLGGRKVIINIAT